MSLQDIERTKSRRRWQMFETATVTVSGAAGSRILNGSNAEYVIGGGYQWLGGGSTSAGQAVTVVAYSGITQAPEVEEYDPAFVTRILDAAAQPPEAKFNNVVDMLNWLNRD
jgi:hypothetical protein